MNYSSGETDLMDESLLSSPEGLQNSLILPVEELEFYTKREQQARSARRTPCRNLLPPQPPVKSAPPVSRIFENNRQAGPTPVSFRRNISLDSPFFNRQLKKTYFEQCFSNSAKIGQGSFGEVFKATCKEDRKTYAIKKAYRKSLTVGRRRQVTREVETYEVVPEHPNIVKFYAAWEEEDQLYIKLELCRESLSQYALREHEIEESKVWTIFADLLFAVHHLHTYNMVHMDIKPENIFIAYDGVYKLGDLGLVFSLNGCQRKDDVEEGDGRYLAVEAFNNNPGKPCDIFSLGMTVLELATDLHVPLRGTLWHNLRNGQLPWKLMAHLSDTLQYVIEWMLLMEYMQRPTAKNLLEHPELHQKWQDRAKMYNFQQKVEVNPTLPALKDLAKQIVKIRPNGEEEKEPCDPDDTLNSSMASETRNSDEVDGLTMGCSSTLQLPSILERPRCVRTEPLRRTYSSRATTGYFQSPFRNIKMARVEKNGDDSYEDDENESNKESRLSDGDRLCNPKNLLSLFDKASKAGSDEDNVEIAGMSPLQSKSAFQDDSYSTEASTTTHPTENGEDREISMDLDDSWNNLSIESSPHNQFLDKLSPNE